GAFVTMTVCARAAPAPAVTLSAQTPITNHKSLIDIRVLEAGSPDELTRQHITSAPHARFASVRHCQIGINEAGNVLVSERGERRVAHVRRETASQGRVQARSRTWPALCTP